MSGGFSDIFSSNNSGSESLLTDSQNLLLDRISKIAFNQSGVGAEVYEGPLVPGQDPASLDAYNQASGINQFQQGESGIQGAIQSVLSGAGDPEGVRDVYNAALGPARLDFDRTLNDVANRYGDVWGSSGAMPEFMARSTAEYGLGLNQLLGELTYNDRQSARNRQATGLTSASTAMEQMNRNNAALYGMGQEARQVEGQQNEAEYAKYLSGQYYNNPGLSFVSPALGTNARALRDEGGGDSLLSAIGGVGGVVGGLFSMFGGA